MNHVGFEDLPHDKALDTRARVQLIDFACRMKSEECLSHMHSQLKSHIAEGEKLPVNSQSSVFCFGLMASALSGGDVELVEELWKKMQASGNTEYRLRIIKSLGCYSDRKALYDFLETILGSTTEVRYVGAESFEIIQAVSTSSVEGVEATLDFMIEFNSNAVRRSQKANLVEILQENLSKRIYNERLFEKVS